MSLYLDDGEEFELEMSEDYTPAPTTPKSGCVACDEVQEAKRAAIVAVPMTKPNPRWLKRFRSVAQDLLLQREFSNRFVEGKGDIADNEWMHVGEPWGRKDMCSGWTDDEIIEEACKFADWMRFKRQALVIGEPTLVANAFAGMIHQSSRYEDVKAAVKVERMIPDPEGEAQVARLRNSLPDKCADHIELDRLMAENAKLRSAQGVEQAKEYIKLSAKLAKLKGEELEGKVRIVSLEPSGKQPLQGEIFKPALAPYSIPESDQPKQDWSTASQEARLLAEMRREERAESDAKFQATLLKAKGSDNIGDLDEAYAKLGTHRMLCRCVTCAHERSSRAKGTKSVWSV